MHLEDYHGERSEEDVRHPLSANLDENDFIDDDSTQLMTSMALTTMGIGQPHCWPASQTDNGSFFFSSLDSGAEPREYLNCWDQMSPVFQYPPSQYPSVDGGSPASTCSEATTPTWSNTLTTAEDRGSEDKLDSSAQKLPPVGSAFSFSRTFCNTIYPENGGVEGYQDYQDCQEDMISLLMSLQNDGVQERYCPPMQTSVGDEFDLNLIRGDPTSLLNTVDSSSSPPSCLADDPQQELPFQNFNGQYYAVGHLVSSQQQQRQSSALSAISFQSTGENGATESFDNQVILPRNEGLLLGNRRVAAPKVVDKSDISYGKFILPRSSFILPGDLFPAFWTWILLFST